MNQASQDGRTGPTVEQTDGLTANMQGRMRNAIDTSSLGGITILCVWQVSFKIREVEIHKPGLWSALPYCRCERVEKVSEWTFLSEDKVRLESFFV